MTNVENTSQDKLSKLMAKKEVVAFTRLGSVKSSDTKDSYWFQPIVIYEGTTKTKELIYLAFNPETDSLTVINEDFFLADSTLE